MPRRQKLPAEMVRSLRSSLKEDLNQLRRVWRRGSQDTAKLLRAVLTQLKYEMKEEAFSLGEFVRYRAGDDEWAIVVGEYLGSQNRRTAISLSIVLGCGHAPLLKKLLSGSLEDFEAFIRGFPLSEGTSVMSAGGFFAKTGGLQGFNRGQRLAARTLFLGLLERGVEGRASVDPDSPPQRKVTLDIRGRGKSNPTYDIGGKPFNPQSCYRMAILGLEQIGSGEDFQRLVPYINRLGSRWGGYVIRVVLPYRPKGLQRQLEEVIATKKRPWILAVSLAALMELIGLKSEKVVRDFLKQDPERNRSIVVLALRKKYPVRYYGDDWAKRLEKLERPNGS